MTAGGFGGMQGGSSGRYAPIAGMTAVALNATSANPEAASGQSRLMATVEARRRCQLELRRQAGG
jgi:hypothetical protein